MSAWPVEPSVAIPVTLTAVERYLNPCVVGEGRLEPLVTFGVCPCDDKKEAAHGGSTWQN